MANLSGDDDRKPGAILTGGGGFIGHYLVLSLQLPAFTEWLDSHPENCFDGA
jgi:hypothetical protein